MRNKGIRLALLLLGVFLLYIYYFEYFMPYEKALMEKKVAPIESGSIRWIGIGNDYGEFRIEYTNGEWRLEENILASDYIMRTILEHVESSTHLKELEKLPKDFEKEWGFDKDPLKLVIGAKPQVTLWVSKQTNFQGNHYLKRKIDSETKYFLVEPRWISEYNKAYFYFRNKYVLNKDLNDFTSFQLVKDGKLVYQVHQKEGQWFYNEENIEASMVYQFIDKWVSLKSVDILDEVKKKRLESLDIGKNNFVSISLKDNDSVKIYFKKIQGERYYLHHRDKVFEVFSSSLSHLKWRRDDFKDRKKPFRANLKDIEQIRYEIDGKEVFDLKKEDFSLSKFAKNWLRLEVSDYDVKGLPPHLNHRLILSFKENDPLAMSWSESKEKKVPSKQVMTSSKISETFLVDKKKWQELMNSLKE